MARSARVLPNEAAEVVGPAGTVLSREAVARRVLGPCRVEPPGRVVVRGLAQAVVTSQPVDITFRDVERRGRGGGGARLHEYSRGRL